MANETIFNRVSSVITVWAFGSAVVIDAASHFLQIDVAGKKLPSLSEWSSTFSFIALILLMIGVLAWATNYIGSRMGDISRPLTTGEAHDLEDAVNRRLKQINLGDSITSVTTTFSQGRSLYTHGVVEYEGKVTVHATPKTKE